VTDAPQAGPQIVVAAGAVAVDGEGRVLLVRRGHAPSVGEWTLPGGRVEPGETPEAAIVRELREETALAGRVLAALGVVTLAREGTTYVIHEYLVGVEGTGATAGDDAAELRWVGPEDIDGALDALAMRADAARVIHDGLRVLRGGEGDSGESETD
jgi:mutator protein MutT